MTNRFELFTKYAKELSLYDKSIAEYTFPEMYNWFIQYQSEDIDWVEIKDKNKIVGFIIICPKESGDCHPNCDYNIAQAYVLPEHRGKHLLTKHLHKYISEHKGKYCYDVIKGNVIADKVWKKLFSHENSHPITIWEVREDVDNLILYGIEVA